MEAILKFNLPEEQSEYNTANKAGDYMCAIHEFTNYLRGKVKYGEEETVRWDEVYKEWWENLGSYGIDPFNEP